MFLLNGHGKSAVLYGNKDAYAEGRSMTAEAAGGFRQGTYPPDPRTGPFDYYFPDAGSLSEDATHMTAGRCHVNFAAVVHASVWA